MFTGIVEELGQVVALEVIGSSARLTVQAPLITPGTELGQSVAVNGCCLTVAATAQDTFTADLMAETLTRTNLGDLQPGERVNLERALSPTGRLDGHVVQGHVDATGTVLARRHEPRWDLVEVSVPAALLRYVAAKGSIAIDGTSLTVVEVKDPVATDSAPTDPVPTSPVPAGSCASGTSRAVGTPVLPADAAADDADDHAPTRLREGSLTVSLIPETLSRTTLGTKAVGQRVNLETDVIAKHVERLLLAPR